MASIGTDTFFAPLSELNASLKAREFSAEDLARAVSERLQQLGPRYNALALPLHQEALRQAKEVDKELKRQRYRGPLQGIPYGVKDLLAFAGQPTTWGAKPYAGQVFDYNATVIEMLSAAGAVLAGKLSMVELAGGGGYRFPSASLTGPGLNPWDRTRWSGGSSSGSAAAVAAGLVPFAIGSETSGSIVTPASFCGVTALRPTYGLVSRHGAMALSWTLDKLGPFARSAEDCGLILQTIAGKDSKDPGTRRKDFLLHPPIRPPHEGSARGVRARRFRRVGQPRHAPCLRGRHRGAQGVPHAIRGNQAAGPALRRGAFPHPRRRNGVDLRAADRERQGGGTGRQTADRRPQSQPGPARQGLPEGDAAAPADAGRGGQTLRLGGRPAGPRPRRHRFQNRSAARSRPRRWSSA